MAGDGVIGALLVTLGVDTGAFEDGLKSTTGKMQSFASMGKSIVGGFLGGFAATLAKDGVQAVTSFSQKLLETADSIDDTSKLIGMSAENVQIFSEAFKKAGADPEVFEGAISKLNKGIGQFIKTGTGPAAQAFKELGIAQDIQSGKLKGTEQIFLAASNALQNVSDESVKAAISGQLFSKAYGDQMIEVVGDSKNGIDDLIISLKKVGSAFSDEEIEKLAGYNQAWKDFKEESLKEISEVIGKTLISIGELIESGTKIVDAWENTDPALKAAIITFGSLTAAAVLIPPAIISIGTAFSAAAALATGTLIPAIIATAPIWAPIALGIGAVSAAVYAFVKWKPQIIEFCKNVSDAFINFNKPLIDAAKVWITLGKNIIEGLVNGIKNGAQWAVDAIKNLANQMITGFKKAWGIQSPSKIAAEDGKFIAEGLAKGINDNAYIPLDALDNLSFELMKKLNGEKWKEILSSDLKSLIGDLKTPLEKEGDTFRASENTLKNALQAKLISQTEYNKQMERLQAEHLENMRKFSDELIKLKDISATDISSGVDFEKSPYIKDGVDGFAKAIEDNQRMSDAFANTMKNGLEAALDGDFKSFATSILKGIADKAFTSIFQQLGDSIFGVKRGANDNGGIIQIISSAFSSIFGGGKAGGGSVNSGTPYLIGEVGPELFVPSTSGTIIPNNMLGGGGNGLRTLIVQLPIGENMHNYMVDIATGKAVEVTGAALSAINTRQQRKATYGT